MTARRIRLLQEDVVGDIPDPTSLVDLGWDTLPRDPPGEPPKTWLVPVRRTSRQKPADDEFW